MTINLMTNKDITIKNLKTREAEINEELEYKNTETLSEELYEIKDTLKKLGVNENDNYNFS
tara:strand:+ start:451 stop:633 length:183 start_codon:yes stop_codon:yes gene_type:complete